MANTCSIVYGRRPACEVIVGSALAQHELGLITKESTMPRGKSSSSYRSAVTGRYITKRTAERSPRTSVKETKKRSR